MTHSAKDTDRIQTIRMPRDVPTVNAYGNQRGGARTQCVEREEGEHCEKKKGLRESLTMKSFSSSSPPSGVAAIVILPDCEAKCDPLNPPFEALSLLPPPPPLLVVTLNSALICVESVPRVRLATKVEPDGEPILAVLSS